MQAGCAPSHAPPIHLRVCDPVIAYFPMSLHLKSYIVSIHYQSQRLLFVVQNNIHTYKLYLHLIDERVCILLSTLRSEKALFVFGRKEEERRQETV